MRFLVITIALALLSYAPPASGARVKDIASIYGVRDNTIFGYGQGIRDATRPRFGPWPIGSRGLDLPSVPTKFWRETWLWSWLPQGCLQVQDLVTGWMWK